MTRKCLPAFAISIAALISTSAGAGGHTGGLHFGGATNSRGAGFVHGRGFGSHGVYGRGAIGVYPGFGSPIYPYFQSDDDEALCDFVWVDRPFGRRVIRQRVYSCQ